MPYINIVARWSKWIAFCFGISGIIASWLFLIKPHEMKRLQTEAQYAVQQFTFDFSNQSAVSLDEIAELFTVVSEAHSDAILGQELNEAFQQIHGLQAVILPSKNQQGEITLFNPYETYKSEPTSKPKCDEARHEHPNRLTRFHHVSVIPVEEDLCIYSASLNMLAILNLRATLDSALEDETTKGYFSMLLEEALPELSISKQLNRMLSHTPYQFLGTEWQIYVYPSQAYVESRIKRKFLIFCMTLLGGIALFSWWLLRVQQKASLSVDEVEHLKQLALYDGVTNLPNRRYCLDHINARIKQASELKRHFAVCFMDCNGFKQINDTYGHPVGDQVLRHIADEVSLVIRKHDFFARYSGDEFCLILESTSKKAELDIAFEKIIEAIAAPLFIGEGSIAISMSIGVTVYPTDGTTADELITRADEAMYDAKRKGEKGYILYS